MAQQKKLPVRKWVPRWLGIMTAFIIMFPILLINGSYTGSSIEISGALGVLSEDISMAYYAASAGMAVAYPLIPKIRAIVTTKTILLCDLILQIGLSLICAQTIHTEVITICSFCIGFLKAFVMIEMIVILKPFFSPKDVRSEFYSYFYPIVFSVGQFSMIITAQLAYSYQWQYMYYFVILLLLIALIFILVCFRYGRRPIRIPFREIDWPSVILISTVMLMTLYVATYGKTKDWFTSGEILYATILIPPLLWLFIHRQRHSETPYLKLEILSSWKAIIGYLFMALVMFFSASSSIISSYTNSVLKIDSVHSNNLNLWMIPGYIIGATISFWWLRLQVIRFRVLIFWGMSCFVAYLAILYFGLTPTGTYEALRLPMLFRGTGMMILFIAFGVYAVEGMKPQLMIYNAFFLISVRSAIAPALSASFFTNMTYRLQQQGLALLSETIDLQNPLAASRYTQSLNNALAQGNSLQDAQLLATNTLYSALQIQSLMLSLKTLVGYILIFAIVVMIISRFIPFHKTLKVKVVKTGEDMV